MSSRPLAAAAVTAALLALPAAASAHTDSPAIPARAAKSTITMSGSTSVYPLAVRLASAYARKYPGRAGFNILQGGSDIGINDVARNRVTIGNSSRDPESADPGGLVFNKIARDGICVITNKANPIGDLSQAQIKNIFLGTTRTWGDIPGAKVGGSISVITRTAASGTADAFTNIFLGPGLRVAANAAAKNSNGLVRQTVASNQRAIGFVSFDFTSGVNPVGYKSVPCNLRNAKSGQYAGVRNFWMVTRGKATGAAAQFIAWTRSNATAKAIIASKWIPLS